jgi:solute carrier family 25 (mitochondrial citrate transporter), member 1
MIRCSDDDHLNQGVMATILKQGSNQGLRFMFFNKYKDIMTDNGKKSLPPLLALVGGMVSYI